MVKEANGKRILSLKDIANIRNVVAKFFAVVCARKQCLIDNDIKSHRGHSRFKDEKSRYASRKNSKSWGFREIKTVRAPQDY